MLDLMHLGASFNWKGMGKFLYCFDVVLISMCHL